MKLYQLVLVVLYIASGVVPLITLFKRELFKTESYSDEFRNPYSFGWFALQLCVLLIVCIVWLCNRFINFLFTIDWNLTVF